MVAIYTAHVSNVLSFCIGACGAFLVIIDVSFNNWEINHILGNAQYFITPFANLPTLNAIKTHYLFPNEASPDILSEVAEFMMNYSIASAIKHDDGHYMLTAGSHVILDAAKDTCGSLVRTYPLKSAMDTLAGTVRLGIVFDRLQYVRGNLFEHMSGTADTRPAPADATDAVLTDLGYKPTRMDCDMRLTTPIQVPEASGVVVSTNTSMFRVYAKSFCTACTPIVEFGHDICALNMTYNATAQTITVLSSKARIGGVHMVGLMLQRTAASVASLVVRALCVLLAIFGYIASQKTIRWCDATALSTWYKRAIYTLSPPIYRYSSYAFSFSSFCLNSDLFVFGYMIAVLLDEKHSMIYSRNIYRWNDDGNNSWISMQLFAIQFRWLWLNCAIVKLFKVVLNFVSLTRSVFYIYLGAVVLLFRIKLIEGINSDMVGLSPTTEPLDGLRLDVFDGYYIRTVPDILVVMTINLMVVLTIDHLVHLRWWRRVAKSSLGRQTMFNSTSILNEMRCDFYHVDGYKNQAVKIQARALCTIQWFLMCHTMCFGLPEDPKRIRALTSHGARTDAPTTQCLSKSTSKTDLLQLKEENPGYKYLTVRPKKDETDDAPSEDMTQMCILVQDSDGNIRMYDSRRSELVGLSVEVKILNNGKFTIG
ncbi:hypothetical protein AC1031_013373 [Aphanomyces cochlioides]|nr:hypothetical protein AC1031_013373 [Aphanomyces cochlioides]